MYKQLIVRAAICAVSLCTCITSDAMSYYRNNGVLKIWGDADDNDRTKLKEQLTPDVKTIILRSPDKGSWTLARDLAAIVEDAQVTTVTEGWCANFICTMIFLSGKERMFSASMRPEASYIKLGISTSHFPAGGEDSGRPWLDVTSWWRDHTKLARTEVWPRHAPIIRPPGIQPAEHLVFFHPSAKTSKGSAAECWGEKQQLPFCAPMADGRDALNAGVITTLERYVPNKEDFYNDITPPAPTSFAALEDTQLKIEKINEACGKYYGDFLAYDSPRAFVISSGGGCYSAYAQQATPYKTAMENCRKWANAGTGRSCRFYTIDDKVVFTPFSQPDPYARAAVAPQASAASSSAAAGIKLPADSAQIVFARSVKDGAPQDLTDIFPLQGKLAIHTTFRWEPVDLEAGRQAIEVRWLNGDKLVYVSRSNVNFKTTPHRVWFQPQASDIGPGNIRAEVYANGVLMGSKTLRIADAASNPVQ